jgi:hypothetical protein
MEMGTVQKAIALTLFIAAVAAGSHLLAEDAAKDALKPASLTAEQVVDNLVRRNQERAHLLAQSQATRVYHLAYRGFPGDREAEMTVEASFLSPTTKDFKIVSQSGSKLIVDRVFKKLLESEQEAAQPELSARTQLNRENYDFELAGFEPSETGGQYLLNVSPKEKSKYVYRGRIWVDAADFAVVRIEAEPAQNPSFWTKKSQIHHEYKKVQDFWLPVRNESVSFIRLGGTATLTIEYKNYRVTGASSPIVSAAMTPASQRSKE